jgi:hypothetical protein
MPIPDVDFSKLEECQRHDRIVELVDQLIDAKSRLKHCLLPQEVNLILISKKTPQNAGAALSMVGSPPQLSGAADAMSSD